LLTSEDLALVAPTARGALNFVGAEFFGADQTRREKAIKKEGAIATVGRYCINPEVRTAVVNVINAAVDSNHPKELVQETLSTIFKNAFDFDYLNELMQIIQTECGAFYDDIDQLCADWGLRQHLRLKGVVFSCMDRKVAMHARVREVDQEFARETTNVLTTFSIPSTVSSAIIRHFQGWESFDSVVSTTRVNAQRLLNNNTFHDVWMLFECAYEEELIGPDFVKNLTEFQIIGFHQILKPGRPALQPLLERHKEVLFGFSTEVVRLLSGFHIQAHLLSRKITVSDLVQIDTIARKMPVNDKDLSLQCNCSDADKLKLWIAENQAILIERGSFKAAVGRSPGCADRLADYPAVLALLQSAYEDGVIGESYFQDLPLATIFALNTMLSSRAPGIVTLLEKHGHNIVLRFGRALLVALAHQRKMHPLIERGAMTLEILTALDGILKRKQLDSRALTGDCDLSDIDAIKAWIARNR